MIGIRRRLERVEEQTGTGEAVVVFLEVAIDEKRTGQEIWDAMGWQVHPSSVRDRVRWLEEQSCTEGGRAAVRSCMTLRATPE